MKLSELIELEEGFRERAYLCTSGYPTIGLGTKIGPKGAELYNYTFMVNRAIAEAMMQKELAHAEVKLAECDWFLGLDLERSKIIMSMCYQMGVSGVFKFKNMIAAIERKDWARASREALDSKWARQTPERAGRHAQVLLTGDFDSVKYYR